MPLHHAYGFGSPPLAAALRKHTRRSSSSAEPAGYLSRPLDGEGVSVGAGVTPLLRLLADAADRPARPSRIGYLWRACRWTRRTAEGFVGPNSARLARRGLRHDREPVRSGSAEQAGRSARSLGEPLAGSRSTSTVEPGPLPSAATGRFPGPDRRSLGRRDDRIPVSDRVESEPVANGFVTGDIGRMTPHGLVIAGAAGELRDVERDEGGRRGGGRGRVAGVCRPCAACLVEGEPDEWRGQQIRATVTPADVDL